ncbi:MAG: hypothetical protein ACLR23_12135 [Clostridia bacterium]
MFINYFKLLETSGQEYANVLYLSDAYPAGRRMIPPSDHEMLISQKGIFRSQGMESVPWYTQAVDLGGTNTGSARVKGLIGFAWQSN